MTRPQDNMIGNSLALGEALQHVSHLAAINRPVLIMGERGTGKELVAERLHFLSQRWDGPFLKVNCAAIADQLLDSELFGHEPGAFTGANRTHHGRFERADGGTLFLDELGTMSSRLQEKLLRLVEYGEFERLGGQQTLQVDVRVLAATHADLRSLAARGEFRDDLLDRLSFDVVHLPSLRHRAEDIPLLAEHFATRICRELGWDMFPGFSSRAMSKLTTHQWPGNVRELRNAVERSVYRWGKPDKRVDEVVIDPFQSPFKQQRVEDTTSAPSTTQLALAPRKDFNTLITDYEHKLVVDALARNNHHQRDTADDLGLSYDQLRGLVRKYQLSTRRRRR